MTVEIRIPTVLRPAVGGQSVVKADGETIGELLASLAGEYPAIAGQVIGSDGTMHRFVNIYLNDDDVRYLSKLDTKVAEGDVVSILPAVAGGSDSLPHRQ
ncbi:MAG: MoaD/ThiS family protein [Nitrospiraceae bacterium]|nr:MoaD/ThiS family protein [Nitrospiraceae bacterium]